MLKNIIGVIRWSATLGKHFFKVVPFATTAVVAMTLTSQVALILSFFLPLKVIILLGSEGVPGYLRFLGDIDRETLILLLSGLTVTAYASHSLAQKICTWATSYGVRRLLEKSHKMALFENQDDIAANGFRKYAEALAGATFFGLSIALLSYFYPEVAFVSILFIMLCLTIGNIVWKTSTSAKEKLVDSFTRVVNSAASLAFMVIFVFVVADFLITEPPGFIVAIIAVLLSRQFFGRLGTSINNLYSLYRQHDKLNALYFHGHAFKPLPSKEEKGVWRLMEKSYREEWVKTVLEDHFKQNLDDLMIQWHQTSLNNVLGLQAELPILKKKVLLKVYGGKNTSTAVHEASLLLDPPNDLPSPPLLFSCLVDRYHCHGFDISNLETPSKEILLNAEKDLRKALLLVEPSEELAKRYIRSSQMLWQRINRSTLERLRLVANDDELAHIEQFLYELPDIQHTLKNLPLTFYNPHIKDLLFSNREKSIWLSHWGKWKLEPAGAGWPTKEKPLKELQKTILHASERRSILKDFSINSYSLAALVYSLELEFNKQRYKEVISLLPRIIECHKLTLS